MLHAEEKSKIFLVGGGSGGHITPILAIAQELKAIDSGLKLTYIGEKGGKFLHIAKGSSHIDKEIQVRAGKFRRYPGLSGIQRLIDVRTHILNIRDVFYVIVGFLQSMKLLYKEKPNAVFIKGGFVGVPVGMAAHILRLPIITHDSDSVPGLANRIVGRWAKVHAMGMPTDNKKSVDSRFVGIPISKQFQPVNEHMQNIYKEQLRIPASSRVILITGGSQGARGLNNLVAPALAELVLDGKDVFILHQTGSGNEDVYDSFDVPKQNFIVKDYFENMYVYCGAADLVISRAGATTVAELAVQQKAVILIPHPHLAGSHQVENATHLASLDAAIVVEEDDLRQDKTILKQTISKLLFEPNYKEQLANNLASLARPDAAKQIARIIIENKRDI